MKRIVSVILAALGFVLATVQQVPAQTDPLPSWNDGAAKESIIAFVYKVTKKGGGEFVPSKDRIAVFDNDGTLWAEQPMYFQHFFALDRVKALAPQHPEWKDKEPFASLLKGDVKGALAGGERPMLEIVMATHAGMTTEEFERTVKDWLEIAKHPRLDRSYTGLVYQPMLELLPEIDFIDDKAGKPVGIHKSIGRWPLMAFGNSDGDFEMLEWTTSGPGPRFGLLVHHDDADREWAYDRESLVGRLNRGLDEGPKRGWIIAGMQRDWKRVFPPVRASAGGRPPEH